MNTPTYPTFGIDTLRKAVALFADCNESFNQRYTPEQLIKIAEVHFKQVNSKAGWDIYPDQWTDQQVKQALKGIVPQWCDDNEGYPVPVYGKLVEKGK